MPCLRATKQLLGERAQSIYCYILLLHAISHSNVCVKRHHRFPSASFDRWNSGILVTQSETRVTCASCPLVSPDMRSVVGVHLAMFWGCDIQAAVPLDGYL